MLGRHFVSCKHLTTEDLSVLLDVAVYLKARRAKGLPETALAGKTLGMVFEKPSLRTRASFEMGMVELGGRAMYISKDEVGIGTREPAKDVARVLSRYVQGIMIRTFSQATVDALAEYASVPVINGLSDECHPCQAVGDILTLIEHFPQVAGLSVAFIGDGNNVARSLARLLPLCGAKLVLACPKGYGFTPADQAEFGPHLGKDVVEINDPIQAVRGVDVLYSDVWTSMGQEKERAERMQAFAKFCIDAKLIAATGKAAKVMHCLPARRGEEITDEAMECATSIVFDQAENRLHAQKAILRLLMADDREKVITAARKQKG